MKDLNMQVTTAPSFTEHLCAAYDFNRGFAPPEGAERATRADILEYIDAHDIAHSPGHPTSALAWDLQRTLGESEGRRMLLYASRRWDAKPLRARDVVRRWWDDDYEPQAWVDEYLVDVIRSWRSERDRLRLCEEAKKEWLTFNGVASQDQFLAWFDRYGAWYLSPAEKLGRVRVVSAKQLKFAEDMRAGRIPGPGAPQDPTPSGFRPRLGPTLLGRKRK
jgi:hypothetical protein